MKKIRIKQLKECLSLFAAVVNCKTFGHLLDQIKPKKHLKCANLLCLKPQKCGTLDAEDHTLVVVVVVA